MCCDTGSEPQGGSLARTSATGEVLVFCGLSQYHCVCMRYVRLREGEGVYGFKSALAKEEEYQTSRQIGHPTGEMIPSPGFFTLLSISRWAN